MAKKKSLEDEITSFVEVLDFDKLTVFLKDVMPLFELFNVDDDNDWVANEVGAENERNVRLIRVVYLLSRIADFHAGRLCAINVHHKGLWKKLEESRSN